MSETITIVTILLLAAGIVAWECYAARQRARFAEAIDRDPVLAAAFRDGTAHLVAEGLPRAEAAYYVLEAMADTLARWRERDRLAAEFQELRAAAREIAAGDLVPRIDEAEQQAMRRLEEVWT